MSRPGFLNENEARAYPFVPSGPPLFHGGEPVSLPYTAIVDFGCIMGLDAGFDDASHSVQLYAISREGDAFWFDFRCNAPGLTMQALRFMRSLTDPEFATEEAESVSLNSDATVSTCVTIRDDPLWEGFLVTGSLQELADVLPTGSALTAGEARLTIEPTLVQNLAKGYVRTINLANEDRTRATAPEGCAEDGETLPENAQHRMIVNRECLSGPQTLRQGYNCTIRQNARDNSLTISAALAGGAGQPCDEVKLTSDEVPPTGSSLLTGGPACGELLNSINGLTGSNLQLVAKQGVRVIVAALPNTLIVDFDLHDLTICTSDDSSSTAQG